MRIGTSLKNPRAKMEQRITINSVKRAMPKFSASSGVRPPSRPKPPVASLMAVPARLIPMTTITGPVTTGGNTFLILSAPMEYAIRAKSR